MTFWISSKVPSNVPHQWEIGFPCFLWSFNKETIHGTIFVPFSIGEGFKKIARHIKAVHGYNLLQNEPSLAIFCL